MPRTTVTATIDRVRRRLSSGIRLEVNFLAATINSSVTSLTTTLALPAGLQVGSIIHLDTEAMVVTARDATTLTVTVVRGYGGTTAASHTIGTQIYVNPRFATVDIFEALQAEIASYGPQLFWVDEDELSVAATTDLLPLTKSGWSDIFGVIDVRRQWTIHDDSTAWPRVNFRYQRDGATAVGGSGALRLWEGVEAGTIYVQVARPFVYSTLTTASDLVTDARLPESMLDVVEMGTMLRLMVDSENGRTARSNQDEPRRAEETPVGATVQPFQFNNALYRNRKQEEVNKLRAQWPMRFG